MTSSAIIVVKQLFGGIGKNFLNPALAGRAFADGQLSRCDAHDPWVLPGQENWAAIGRG